MRGFKKINQRRIAAGLAAILLVLSTVTVMRERGMFADEQDGAASSESVQQQEEVAEVPAEIPAAPEQEITAVSEHYTATAATGDSYTAHAREAISAYAQQHSLELSPAQALTAEVALVNQADAPLLEIGDTVEIADSTIAASLEGTSEPEEAIITAEETTVASEEAATQTDQTPASDDDYEAVAVVGDSYTVHARTAVSQYADASDISLTNEQRVAAETFIASAASMPELDVAQAVTIDAGAVENAVTEAQQLSAEQQQAWAPYALLVAL